MDKCDPLNTLSKDDYTEEFRQFMSSQYRILTGKSGRCPYCDLSVDWQLNRCPHCHDSFSDIEKRRQRLAFAKKVAKFKEPQEPIIQHLVDLIK